MSLRDSKIVRATAGLLVLAAVGLVGACSSSSGYATEADFCQALATAKCSNAVVTACYVGAPSAQASQTDVQSCVAATAAEANCNPLKLVYHPIGSDVCVQTTTTAYADAVLARGDVDAMTQDCITVFNKGGTQGMRCEADTDCDTSTGLKCVLHAGAGQCAVPQIVGAGLSCAAVNAACDVGLYCDSGLHCVEGNAAGQVCSTTIPCKTGLRCSAKGACAARLGNGAACTEDEECLGDGSLGGGFCTKARGQTTGTCTSVLQISALSSSCDEFLGSAVSSQSPM